MQPIAASSVQFLGSASSPFEGSRLDDHAQLEACITTIILLHSSLDHSVLCISGEQLRRSIAVLPLALRLLHIAGQSGHRIGHLSVPAGQDAQASQGKAMAVKSYYQGCMLGMIFLRTHRRVKDYHCQRREAPVCSHWRIDNS